MSQAGRVSETDCILTCMDFSEAKTHAISVMFDTDVFAQTGVYNDGTTDIDVTVLIESDSDGAGNTGIEAMAYVQKVDVPAPEYRHTITVDGVTWTIDQTKHGVGYKNDGDVWQLPLIREPRSKQWRR